MNDEEMDFEEEEEEDGEVWLASYSDLMSDLLAVFIMLYSFALLSQGVSHTTSQAANHMEELINSYNSYANEIGLNESSSIPQLFDPYNNIVQSVQNYIEEKGLSEQLSVVDAGENVIIIRGNDRLFFSSGSSEFNPEALPVITGIADILQAYIDNIETVKIEGHTDSNPINTARFESNWELSADRAVKVLKELIAASDIEDSKFSAVGYAEFQPIADNTSEEGRMQNRRVDFVITVANQNRE